MIMLKDVKKIRGIVDFSIDLYGCSDKFKSEFIKRYQAIGKVMRGDYGISIEKALVLPDETELSQKAEVKFAELREWLNTQHSSFKF